MKFVQVLGLDEVGSSSRTGRSLIKSSGLDEVVGLYVNLFFRLE
jgi:hypothetical protein